MPILDKHPIENLPLTPAKQNLDVYTDRQKALSDFDQEHRQSVTRKEVSRYSSEIKELLAEIERLVDRRAVDLTEPLVEQILRFDPSAQDLFDLASVYYTHQYDEMALRYYMDALVRIDQDEPFLFETYKNIGNIYVRNGDWDAAEENFNRAFTINPDSSVLFVNYGTLEMQRGDLEAAKLRYRQAVALDARNSKAWIGLALVHRQYSDMELSWANLEQALESEPTNELVVQLIGDWGLADGRWQTAIRHLEVAHFTHKIQCAGPLLMQCYGRLGDFQRANQLEATLK